jgi:hypothetical protein
MDGVRGRVGRAAAEGRLSLDDICRPRIPFAPVFRRELLGDGWPEVVFAEDMVFNFGLALRAPTYAFVEDACYLYHLRPGSLSEDPATIDRALRGYAQILTYLERADWPLSARALLRSAIGEDVARVDAARSREGGLSWRHAVREAPAAIVED